MKSNNNNNDRKFKKIKNIQQNRKMSQENKIKTQKDRESFEREKKRETFEDLLTNNRAITQQSCRVWGAYYTKTN